MSKEAMNLALEKFAKVKELCDKHGGKINRKHVYGGALIEHFDVVCQAMAEQPAPVQQEPEYTWPTVADYERDVGFETNQAFRMAWNMARTTNIMLGHTSPPAQHTWVGLIRGVRVEGDAVVITVKGGNDAARELCGALLKEKNT